MTITNIIDVSHWNAPLSVRGAAAVIAKASQGSTFSDPSYNYFRNQSSGFKIPFAAYHWIDTSSIAGQAARAYAAIGPGVPTMWDCEAAGATVARIVELTLAFRRLGGHPTLCYLPHWWWQGHLGSPDLRPLVAIGLKLISSEYPAGGYTETGHGWRAYGNITPVIWQYSDGAPGTAPLFNGKRVDHNAFKGTQAQLATVIQGGSMTNPVTPAVNDTAHAVLTGRWRTQSWTPGIDQTLATMVLDIQAQTRALLAAVTAISAKLGSVPNTPSDSVTNAELATALRAAADQLSA